MWLHHLPLVGAACLSAALAGCGTTVSSPATTESSPLSPADPTPVAPGSPDPEIGTAPESPVSVEFNATMTAPEVVPPVYGTAAAGTGTFSLDADRTTLRYSVVHTVEAPTEVHLHLGLAGEAGEVMLPLTMVGGAIEGSVAVTPAQASAIENGRAYVDVHTAAHPAGEIRGQVVRPGEIVYVARLTGDQENPPSDATGAGLAAFLVDGTTNRMRFSVRAAGLSAEPTSAVIAFGPAGLDGPLALDLADPKTPPSTAFSGARTLTSTEDLDLGRWYVNLASQRYPRGEVRGQILRPGQELYVGRLNGTEAIPPVSTSAYGAVSLIVGSNRDRVVYDVAVAGTRPTTGFLGEAPAGETGAPVMPFEVLGDTFRATRWITPDSTLLSSLAVGRVYAAVGSAEHPEGELRGQMVRVGVPR
jgi:hypothetical protein